MIFSTSPGDLVRWPLCTGVGTSDLKGGAMGAHDPCHGRGTGPACVRPPRGSCGRSGIAGRPGSSGMPVWLHELLRRCAPFWLADLRHQRTYGE